MRVLLVNPPIPAYFYNREFYFPSSLLSLGAVLRDAGHEPRILDNCPSLDGLVLGEGETHETLEETYRMIEQIRPDKTIVMNLVPFPGTEVFQQALRDNLLVGVEPQRLYLADDRNFTNYDQVFRNPMPSRSRTSRPSAKIVSGSWSVSSGTVCVPWM